MTLEKLKRFLYSRYHLTEADEPIGKILMSRIVKDKAFENYQELTEEDVYTGLVSREAQGANLHGRLVQLFAYWFIEAGPKR